MDKSPTRCQPCDSFWERDSMYGEHQCVFCGGIVRECGACGKDHHVGGWNSCDVTKTKMTTCRHPACQARVSKEALQDEIDSLRAEVSRLTALVARDGAMGDRCLEGIVAEHADEGARIAELEAEVERLRALLSPKYRGGQWGDRDGVAGEFFPVYDRETRPLPDDFPTDEQIVYAYYSYEDYHGTALVLFERDGTLYEVNGSHCSCMGLEEQWEPEETSWAALAARVGNNWPRFASYPGNPQDAESAALIALVVERRAVEVAAHV